MPLPGGPAEKVGNRYENRWTVFWLAEILAEKARSIRLEPPGADGEGVEFWLEFPDRREYHQVKRQLAGGGWSLSQLGEKGILANFLAKLRRTEGHCVFVSMHAAATLGELADRARSAASFDEFKDAFLESDRVRNGFSVLRAAWDDCSESEAFELLRRVFVRTVDEQTLRDMCEVYLGAIVDGTPALVEASLARFASDSVHHELTAHDIWGHLEDAGFGRRQWGNDPTVLAAVEAANARYLASFPDPTIGGHTIERNEVGTVLATLEDHHGPRGVALVGEAGVGKSSVVRQVLTELRVRGIPFLALRVDKLRFEPRADDLGRQLGLPGSPASVLNAVAHGRDCVLVVDQLDAVSLAAGRHTDLFDPVAEMLRQAAHLPNVFLVVSCREFDLRNDHRLRSLIKKGELAEPLRVQRLSEDTVRKTAAELGLDPTRLSPDQMELLSVPLHLGLLAEIASDAEHDPLAFATATDLFGLFWDRKRDLLVERRGAPLERWPQIMDRLTEYMSGNQTLTAPAVILDDFEHDVRAIVSEHVLVLDEAGNHLAFFHDGFFDYAFARRFLARDGDLLGMLRGSEQGLFRRAQVRQILAFERDQDRSRYLADLGAILADDRIRNHLKWVVLSYLGSLPDPSPEEWSVVEPLLDANEFFREQAWQMLWGSVAWMRLLGDLGVLARRLADDDAQAVDTAVRLMASVVRELPDEMAELLLPYVGHSEEWNQRIRHFMAFPRTSYGLKLHDLLLAAIDVGLLDPDPTGNDRGRDFWHTVYNAAEHHPAATSEAIGRFLGRQLTRADAAGVQDPFSESGLIGRSQYADDVLREAAAGAPSEFIAAMVPFIVAVAERTKSQDAPPPVPDRVWYFRVPDDAHQTPLVLLQATEAALRELARSDPDALEHALGPLVTSDLDTAQFLVVRAYAVNPVRFADAAADFLLQGPHRLRAGYTSDPYAAARELLAAITPHCSPERLGRVERLILDYWPPRERDPAHCKRQGWAQFSLLGGIDPGRRGTTATRRVQELQRKFGMQDPPVPRGVIVGTVRSPIPEAGAAQLTDDHWLRAMAKYVDEELVPPFEDPLKGGSPQLALQLGRRAEADPTRFAQLALRMPDDTNPGYFDGILRGVAQSHQTLAPGDLAALVERCHDLPSRPCGRAIADLLGRAAASALPTRLLDIVGWYATSDPNPDASQEAWQGDYRDGSSDYDGVVETAGVNSVRGGATEAIARLIFADPNRAGHFLPVLDHIVADDSLGVRAWGAYALIAMLAHDRDAAVVRFVRLCDADTVLLGTRLVERLLRLTVETHFAQLEPILARMLASGNARTAQAGARLACLAALELPAAKPLADWCLTAAEPMRLGAAEVYAANLRSAGLRAVCEAALRTLFCDPEVSVRVAAADCFRNLAGNELAEFADLADNFVASPAFADAFPDLFDALEETTASLPDLVCRAAEQMLDIAGAEDADARERISFEIDTVARIVVRAYAQVGDGEDDGVRRRCLDVIDRMTQVRAPGLRRAVEEFER